MNISVLEAAEIDYGEGLHRFMGNAVIYEKFLKKFFNDQRLDKLKIAMNEKDYKKAFEAAHELKGASGNLSINGVFNAASELCDKLSKCAPWPEADGLMTMLEEQYRIANTAADKASQ